ncbi:MAG TPA: LON peptidase substrate-binding domain-containing protein [Burkholderiaceae bacterium]|nr:LON peptidase substrate-binding domain-containing protein [Burkholderiaceae bacterium]
MSPSTLPLFPLSTVLFPGGVLPLRVFETRYMDMVRRAMKDKTPFGVVLIRAGKEVGAPAVPESVGCSARITGWDMSEPGILNISTFGERRFRVEGTSRASDGLLVGVVSWLDEPDTLPVPEELAECVHLLKRVIQDVDGDAGDDPAAQRFAQPHRLDDAGWVAQRLIEILPVPNQAKQKLLELGDPRAQLEIVHAFLKQRKVVG